ncbi:monofunctional biosynthetic peptidoglycan transglycosylase [Shewanella sp. SNU WT4]|uniref:monofunctional biosynthetic peptidoglycan transglycosylase n=1 Tax=Shewanella sp. SNU WT4 TaxID=2590015 RepID=UPI0011293EF2|nr:monofunctional biosynthetic peptidoglycan transglycosylase [Shewanella sp. SNU WT4]QDF66120.1 monofunctional biosynthetic peptidoglycan transglycosylase [Shewanella sp. SNU WT4]
MRFILANHESQGRGQRPLARTLMHSLYWLLLAFIALTFALVLGIKFCDPATWSWRLQQQGINAAPHTWVSLSQINPHMQLAVIAAEDQTFASNDGFDYAAMIAAFEHNQHSKQIRGGSTITQQLAKNLFLWPDRSYFRKALGAWLTLWLEAILPKSRILELYLNIVQLGPDIYGVEDAARHYFGVSARNLTSHQASLLAAILPNPVRYKVKPPSPYVIKRSAWIRKQMRQLGDEPLQQIRSAPHP